MGKRRFLLSPVVFVMIVTGFGTPVKTEDRPGFTITLNGGPFKNQTFFIPPADATYANLYFDSKNDTRARRTVLLGYKTDNTLQIHIDAPIHKIPGSYTFVEDSIPTYMGFQFGYEKDGQSATYFPGRITVTITHYGKVGEYIEGHFAGELGSGEKKVATTGTFKVKRIKDKT